jgi:hypothetical protein
VLGDPAPAAGAEAVALLAAEAEQTGEEIAALAHRILGKAAAYRQALSQLTGWRRGMMQRIEAARSLTELQLVLEAVPEPVAG